METPTTVYKPPEVPKNKYRFYCTGSPEMLLKGIEVELDLSYNPQQCKEYLKSKLQGKINNLERYDIIVYLSGGIPFLGGTLNNLYSKGNGPDAKPYIYAVLTRPVTDKQLNTDYPELCNVSNPDIKFLLSPLYDSTPTGYCNIACLMGYLNHDGVLWDKFLKCSAAVTHFSPFITSLNRLCERNFPVGRDIIAITSTLHTYFSYLLQSLPSPDEVFEYSFRCCNYMINIINDNEKLPMKCADLTSEAGNAALQFLRDLNQPKIFYFWEADSVDDFTYYDVKPFKLTDPEILRDDVLSFAPIAPLSIRVATGCSIVKGKDHMFLYVSQSAQKGAENQNKVDIIDPTTGLTAPVDVELFAREQGNTEVNYNLGNMIDSDRVKQVIFVCFDQSGSMNRGLGGRRAGLKPDEPSRAIIATQYLTSFANKTYGYRIPCIQGLIRFNNEIKISCPLSPLVPDFEQKGLANLKPANKTLLWDSISTACDELVKFTKTASGGSRYKNAVNRILVISDGEDTDSKMNLVDVCKKMIENKIIVDSVLVSSKEKCKELVTLCHITGGLAFRPSTTNEGLLLFEKSAFLNYDERVESSAPLINGDRKTRPKMLTKDSITPDFVKTVLENTTFDDTDIKNKVLQRSTMESRLATPSHICSTNMNTPIQQPRRRRILRELHYAALVMDKNNKETYDPDIVVYPFASCLDYWQVFIRGEEKTPYEGKWFLLFVTFPDLYPNAAPVFRFISIPYSLNVSSEGRICLNVIEKGYMTSTHVIDIIQQIKELFIIPTIDTPVQLEVLETFMENRELYDQKARESALRVGKDDFKEFFPARVSIQDSVEDGFKLSFEKQGAPAYMVSQISGRVIKNPFLASSGVYYEKAELKQMVASNRNPICIITGKPLKERIEDFDDVVE